MSNDAQSARTDAVAEAKARAQRLANAFVAVFGQESRRTPEQTLVLDHLATCAGDETNSYQFNHAKDGVALIAAGIHRDGAKSILLVIQRQIRLADKIFGPKKPKPKVQK